MNDLPYWSIAAVQLWICTREFSYVQKRLTGDVKRDEEQIYAILAEFECNEGYEERSLVDSEQQAKTELSAKLRCGELKAQGVKFGPFNNGQPFSDTFQDIPANDWAVLKIHLFPYDFGGRYVASYGHNWWRHILCPSAVVRKLWPPKPGCDSDAAGNNAAASLPKPRKGGRPGDLGNKYRAEFDRRRQEGIPLCASKADEAAVIVAALQERGDLPKNPSPSVRTAENSISKLYNLAKAALNAA